MSEFDGLYDIRDMHETDKNFVKATFLRGLYHGDSWFSSIPKAIFMSAYDKVIDFLLNSSVVKVACLQDEPETIIGYSIMSPDYQTLHWVYVKKAWRGHGIARSLIPEHPNTVTHLSKLGLQLLPKLKDAVFNPFKLN